MFQRNDSLRKLLSNAGSNHNTIPESRDGSCSEESQGKLKRLEWVKEF
jgi:hypothetical protein